ncbi:hypothetical protein MRB53_038775 [Persea americana]|nr:hypothetical protein MRB53_038775 [Persea americana]
MNSILVINEDDFDVSDEDDDEFGADEIDEASYAAAEAAATQKSAAITPNNMVFVEDENTRLNKTIYLRQSWTDTRCTKDSFVQTHSAACGKLYSKIVSRRRAKPALRWSTGRCFTRYSKNRLRPNRWDEEWFQTIISEIVARHIEDIYAIRLSVIQVVDHLQSKIPALQAWAQVFVSAKANANATVKDRNGKHVKMSVNKIARRRRTRLVAHVWSQRQYRCNCPGVDGRRGGGPHLDRPVRGEDGQEQHQLASSADCTLHSLAVRSIRLVQHPRTMKQH